MTILQANLKHFYQCRGAWLWYFILLSQTQMMLMAYKSNRFFGYLIFSILIATLVTTLQQDVIAKPFSFCMPDHRKTSRKVIMLVGVILNAALGMVFLMYPGLIFPHSLLVSIAGGFVGMAVYLLTARSTFKGLNQWSTSSVIKILLMISFLGAVIYFKFWQEIMIAYPLIVIAISYGICWLMWRWLSHNSLAREVCGKVVPGLTPGWNTQKMHKLRNAKMKELGVKDTPLTNWLGNFFLSKMQKHKFLSQDRYLWGRLYTDFGAFHARSKPAPMVFIIVAVLLYFGYLDMDIGHIIYMLPCIVALNMKMPSYPTLLLPGGRREIFTGILTSVLSVTIIAGVALIILTIISNLAELFLPPINTKTLTLNYISIDIGKFYLFLLIMPIAFSITVLLKQRAMLKMIVMLTLLEVFFFWSLLQKVFLKNSPITIPPITIAAAIIISWLIFVTIAHRVCTKQSLVSQSKG